MPDQELAIALVVADAVGGIGRHVAGLAHGLAARGIDVTVCGPEATLRGLGQLGSVRLVAAPIGRASPAAVVTCRKVLRAAAAGVDIVHGHGLRAGAAIAALAPTAPLAVTWHNAWLGGAPGRLVHSRLERYVARHSELTLAASPDLAAAAQRAGARAVRDIFVATPQTRQPARSRAEVRAELGIGDRPLVLAIGRLHAQKRFDVLVSAAAGWRDAPDAPVVAIAGDGPDRTKLTAQIAAAGAPVRLLGSRDDVPDLLAAADLVALPSSWEARALVAQEALAAGVPLVTTAVGGLPDLVGPAAVTVPVADPAGLRQAIDKVLGDPALRAQLSAAGRARAATWPGPEQVLDELVAAYLDLNRNLRPAD